MANPFKTYKQFKDADASGIWFDIYVFPRSEKAMYNRAETAFENAGYKPKTLFICNALGFEIAKPRIVIDFGD